MYVCFPLLILRSEMFPYRRRYHLTAICPRDTYGSHLGLTWLSPKNVVYYCPGRSKSFASVGSVKNLLSGSGTHSKGLKACLFMNVFWWRHNCTVLGVFLFLRYLNHQNLLQLPLLVKLFHFNPIQLEFNLQSKTTFYM